HRHLLLRQVRHAGLRTPDALHRPAQLRVRDALSRGAEEPEPRQRSRGHRSARAPAAHLRRHEAARHPARAPAPPREAAVLPAAAVDGDDRGVGRRAEELRPEPGLRLRRPPRGGLARPLAVKCQEVVHPSHHWVACGCRPKPTPDPEARMNIHKNARTTPQSRAEIVRRVVVEEQPGRRVAAAFGISERTVRKWVARARQAAELGAASSRPRHRPTELPAALQELIPRLRRQRWSGPQIAAALALSAATVARYLRQHGLARLRALEPPPPVQRYEYRDAGGLVHLD